ncbi:HDIG domain-containing protein [Virgibacillus sp. MSJ-26]|uniref:HD family phosphohydrolase n=1 Tax=Virgibacillus sp. MSJ-26 TaxID=2841522 RepID=UPI001C10EF06|nr:HDIG domain-containing metalloprotein [Virgibacillus sp. MSJ-26]MBU5466430.1 HDIG domain-containing protein [Virgibacillus sp. MSJ-26]
MLTNLKEKISIFLKSKSNWFVISLAVLVLGIFFFLMTFNNVYTKTYDIERFNRAKETIRSPITIENEQETERKTRETSQAVQDRYDISTEITDERIKYVEEIFEALDKMEDEIDGDAEAKKDDKDEEEENDEDKDNAIPFQEKLNHLKEILSEQITDNINDSVLMTLIEIPVEDREEGKKVLIDSLKNTLEKGVRTETIKSASTEVKDNLKFSHLNSELKVALYEVAEFAIAENSFFDVEKTAKARKEAESNVEPVVIRAGEIIVREGQTITNEKYDELILVGLLNKERNIYPIIGLSILIVLLILVIANELVNLDKNNNLDKRKMATILLISVIVVGMMKIVSVFMSQTDQLFYVVPVATGVLLIKQLINDRLAIVLAFLYSILGFVIFNGEIPGSLNMEAGIYFFFSQMAAIIFLRNLKDRLAVIKAGFGMSVINIMSLLLFIFLSFEKYTFIDILIQSGLGITSAFLSTVLTIGLLPFFETGLGILTDIKLLQLSSPNQPLLKKILTEAPGTYHHSVMVANLSETACEAIGANGLLARVGAYYHDIGKTVRPHYFIENQLAVRNPHDFLAPRQSADIIISHPYDGADMLKEAKMPKEIIDIALQHHGTSLLKYFYYKEKENDKSVNEREFRYPGPKPQTKEAAIVCICDSVEAAVRSLKEPTEQKIEDIVTSIVNDRLQDGQLDECPITISELNTIHQTICETLKGIFHSRIQYPTEEAN